jgi:hypothetical protein
MSDDEYVQAITKLAANTTEALTRLTRLAEMVVDLSKRVRAIESHPALSVPPLSDYAH